MGMLGWMSEESQNEAQEDRVAWLEARVKELEAEVARLTAENAKPSLVEFLRENISEHGKGWLFPTHYPERSFWEAAEEAGFVEELDENEWEDLRVYTYQLTEKGRLFCAE